MLPVVLALAAAFLFALGDQFQNQGLIYMDSRASSALSIGVSAAFFLLLAPFLLNWNNLLHPAVLLFVLIGLFRPSISVNLALAGMRFLGPTLATTLTSTSPLFAAALGLLWLGEVLTVEIAAGTFIIVAAVMVLSRRDNAGAATWPLWALALPLAAALIRSIGHVLSKVGMESVPDPYIASMVSFAVSSLVTVLIHKMRRRKPATTRDRRGIAWVSAAGVSYSVAILALNWALHVGTVVQVVPVVSAAPVFTMLLSIAVFRRERLTPRTITVVFMVVPAVVLIAVAG